MEQKNGSFTFLLANNLVIIQSEQACYPFQHIPLDLSIIHQEGFMSKKKLLIAILFILILSAFIAGCGGVPSLDPMDYCCFSGLLPLPLALIGFKLFRA
jgi:hypothetical protein